MKILIFAVTIGATLLPAQTVINGGRTVKGAWDASDAILTKPVKTGGAIPGTCSSGEIFFHTGSPAGQNLYLCSEGNTWTRIAVPALATAPAQCPANTFATGVAPNGDANCTQTPANLRTRPIGYAFDGGGAALTPGLTKYVTVPYSCTIGAWNLVVDTGSATVDVWKTATGTSIPGLANSITASSAPANSAGTPAQRNATLTGWSTAVAANDIIGFNLKAVSGATFVSLVLECNQ